MMGFQALLGFSGHLDRSMVTFLKTSPCAGSDGLRAINAAAAENHSLNKRAEQLLRFLFSDEVIWVRTRESSKKLKGVHEPLCCLKFIMSVLSQNKLHLPFYLLVI